MNNLVFMTKKEHDKLHSIVDEDGEMWSGDFAIDSMGNVYQYDYDESALIFMPFAKAKTAEGLDLKFNFNSPLLTEEIILGTMS